MNQNSNNLSSVYKYFILCEYKLIDITGAESELATKSHHRHEYVKIGDCDVDILDYTGATGSIGNVETSPEVESNALFSNAGTCLKLLDQRQKQCNTLSCSPTSQCSFHLWSCPSSRRRQCAVQHHFSA